MLYREKITVCSDSHTKHINTLSGQKVELLNVMSGGTIIPTKFPGVIRTSPVCV